MFLARQPNTATIRAFVDTQARLPFSYPHVGHSRDGAPAGYAADHNRVALGRGEAAFRRAVTALRSWAMFDVGWARLCWPEAPIAEGTTVAVVVRLFGIWSLNACRIVYVVDDTGETRRYGFAYGTLPAHAEMGEERFTVEWRTADDSVWYDLFAFSRPRHPLARLGHPLARRVQKRFARDSLQAMARATA
jgi:uncharacterized protein (UPF0548 family)